MFLEVDSSEENKLILYRVDGKKDFIELPKSPVYNMAEFRGALYAVAGDSIYKIIETVGGYTYSLIGSADLTLNVTIAANNAGQLCFNSSYTQKAYVLDTNTDTLTQITDPAFYGSPRVDYLDGYGVFVRPNSQQFYISAYNNFSVFDGLEFATNGSDPDNLVTVIVDHRELVLFGRKTMTFWFANDSANTVDFSLSRRDGADSEVGCAAALSVAKLDNTVFFLGRNAYGHGLVYRLNQYVPQIVSNRGIEQMINTFARIDDAIAYAYQKNGHSFYVLTFPTANKTLVYDASIQDPDMAWSVRETYNLGRDRATCHTFAFNKHLVGDYSSGKIFELDENTHLDGGLPIVWSRTSAHIVSDYKRIRHKEVVLNFQTGVGLENGDNPLIYLTYSDDGGHSFITPRESSLGVIGQRKNRVMFSRLGQSRDRVYKVFGSAPVKTVFISGFIELEALNT
jgi:hypothetical protein